MTDLTADLGARGRRMWKSLADLDPDMTDAAREVALEACRIADRLDELDRVCRSEPVMIESPRGTPIAHPAWVEARQQANVLKQLVAALRLPDEQTGKRPQRRGPRGAQRPSTGSARERLRAV